jgi:hypothetical protein
MATAILRFSEILSVARVPYSRSALMKSVGQQFRRRKVKGFNHPLLASQKRAATAHTCGASIQKQQQLAPLFPHILLLTTTERSRYSIDDLHPGALIQLFWIARSYSGNRSAQKCALLPESRFSLVTLTIYGRRNSSPYRLILVSEFRLQLT